MAFNRRVTRYAALTRDEALTKEPGPVLALHNAAILSYGLW